MVGDGKEQRFDRVAAAVVAELLRGSPEDLHYAAIARRAHVSRPWLYKYFGPDRDGLIEYTARLFGDAFARVEAIPPGATVETFRECIATGTRRGFGDVLSAPWCVEFYFRYRHADHGLGRAVREVERRHVENFVGAMPPVLVRDRARAVRFAEVFTSARMALYHRWLDPAFRNAWGEDGGTVEVLHMFDGYVRAELG